MVRPFYSVLLLYTTVFFAFWVINKVLKFYPLLLNIVQHSIFGHTPPNLMHKICNRFSMKINALHTIYALIRSYIIICKDKSFLRANKELSHFFCCKIWDKVFRRLSQQAHTTQNQTIISKIDSEYINIRQPFFLSAWSREYRTFFFGRAAVSGLELFGFAIC